MATFSQIASRPGRPAGYTALIVRYGLDVIPNWHSSWVLTRGVHRRQVHSEGVEETYPATYWPGDRLGDHLTFALKYDGTNLGILAALFRKAPLADILAYVASRPTGKYARRVWFLYEFLTGAQLPLDDLPRVGSYVDLLDADAYYTTTSSRRVQRQRINDNLLGDSRFCPTVRRTDVLRQNESAGVPQRCRELVAAHPRALIKRALAYLYEKETKSSFEIEREVINSSRTDRFVALLQAADQRDYCRPDALIDLQNRIVDPRFRDSGYRQTQNYVGQAVAFDQEIVHFVGAKPADLRDLMAGLIDAHRRMEEGNVSAVIHAAVIAYGFVFLHPFEDGNGRIHRFLIHNILVRRGFTPAGVIFPVSAAMLRRPEDYDASLEAFSKLLMPLVDYTLDLEGLLTISNDTAPWYRWIDFTPQAEALFDFLAQTIEHEFGPELAFLANYDTAKTAIQDIVDMPDRRIDLFIRLCMQNKGQLSATKRKSQFAVLSDLEVTAMEQAVRSAWRQDSTADREFQP